jgi:3-dehydroquinate dehydratase/shikimate dehydrogenase
MPGNNASSEWPILCLTSSCKKSLLESQSSVDWIEWRADLLGLEVEEGLNTQKILWTLRKENQEDDYKNVRAEGLIKALSCYGLVDMQLDHDESLLNSLRPALASKVILSYHGEYQNLNQVQTILMQMRRFSKVRYWKLALSFDHSSLKEIIEVFQLLQTVFKEQMNKIIFIPVGETVSSWRTFSVYLNAPFLFTTPSLSNATAKGQIDLLAAQALKRKSKPQKIYALIGKPVTQSISHLSHNYLMKHLNIDACYLKFHIYEETLHLFLNYALVIGFEGLSITAPYKEKSLQWIKNKTEIVKQVGSINTLTRVQNNWLADNTDYKAFAAILSSLKIGLRPILIVGAGGSARAAIAALKNLKLSNKIFIVNRTFLKAHLLAEEMGVESIDSYQMNDAFLEEIEGVIQVSAIGMTSETSCKTSYPFSFEKFRKDAWLIDLVNFQKDHSHSDSFFLSPLAAYWKSQQQQLIDARTFFFKQASHQFNKWFDLSADFVESYFNQKA